jgi:hypothetical protein
LVLNPLVFPLCIMHFGSILKKNQRLKVLKEDDPEYGRGKSAFAIRVDAY